MPNWCSTSFTVRGPQKEVQDFYDNVIRVKDEDGLPTHHIRILDAYVPTPQELRDTVSGWSSDADEQSEREKKYQANLAKYGAKDWYDWQVKNWGVKWGDCETGFDGEPHPYFHNEMWIVGGYFQTPWGTATEGFRQISEKFPNCLFILDSDEEAGFFAGIEMHHDGDVVFQSYYAPCEYPEDVDWDDDEQREKYEEWKDAQNDKIADESIEYMRNRDWLPRVTPTPRLSPSDRKSVPHVWK